MGCDQRLIKWLKDRNNPMQATHHNPNTRMYIKPFFKSDIIFKILIQNSASNYQKQSISKDETH